MTTPRVVSLLPDSLPADGEDRFTGVACPDCSGVLTLRAHGTLVTFACRIGHMYSYAELLASKEEILERRRPRLEPADPEPQRRRGAIARQEAARLRSIIEADRPLGPRAAEALGDVP